VAAGFLTCLIAATTFDPRYSPHAVFAKPGNCGKCHVYYKEELEPNRFRTDCNDYCMECHTPDQLGRSHPNKVRPRDKYWKMEIPADYRLDDDGRIMCLTCHKAHGPYLSTVKAYSIQNPENVRPPQGVPAYYKTYFVRVTDPEKGYAVLCDGCHKKL